MAGKPVSLAGAGKAGLSHRWLGTAPTITLAHGAIVDVQTSYDSLLESSFASHGTLQK